MNKTYLVHHGIKGQRWGVRRFQNEDGTLTPAGIERYGTVENMQKVRNRNKNIAIGVGATAAVAGISYLAIKNRKQKKKIGAFEEADRLKKLATKSANEKRKATREFNKLHGIKNAKVKLKKHSDVKVTEYVNSNRDVIAKVKDYINIVGGELMPRMGGK